MGVMERRKRRAFTKEFKAETVRLVVEGGRSIPEVARDLDLTESALRLWVHQAEVDAGRGKPGELTTAEREELQRLRRESEDAAPRAGDPEKSGGLLREGERVKFAFIHAEKAKLPTDAPVRSSGRVSQWLLRVEPAPTVEARRRGLRSWSR